MFENTYDLAMGVIAGLNRRGTQAGDASRIRKDHTSADLAVVYHIALNLLRQDSSDREGIKAKRLQAGWGNDYLAQLLST